MYNKAVMDMTIMVMTDNTGNFSPTNSKKLQQKGINPLYTIT